jgi:glucose/arabinose dehydrogenase
VPIPGLSQETEPAISQLLHAFSLPRARAGPRMMRMLLRRQFHVVLLAIWMAGSACGDKPTPPSTPTPGETFTAADGTRFSVQVMFTGLEVPWSLAFTTDDRLFFTERPGRVRVVQGGRLLPAPALTIGDISASGESGALGLTLHPGFATNHFVYVAYTATVTNGTVNRVVRYRELSNTLAEPVVILDGLAASSIHDGCRLRFGPDGKLYVTMGDAANAPVAQDLGSLNGKILRINDDGTVPADNPLGSPIYSYGHRNPQGIDWHPTTRDLWETEHGATGNDEVNRIDAGKNYGWPVIEASQTQAGMEVPVLFFDPSVAPSGASFYTGSSVAGFRNNFFFATLRGQHLHRVRLDAADPRRVAAHEALLQDRFGRIRDVVTAPDGSLYFSTSNRDGRGTPVAEDDRILRITAIP